MCRINFLILVWIRHTPKHSSAVLLLRGVQLAPMAASAAMQPMAAEGSSAANVSNLASRNKIGDALLEHCATTNPAEAALWGSKWDAVPEEHACSNLIHEVNATFLTMVYIIPKGRVNAGNHLSQDSAEAYWGGMIFDLKKRFQHSTSQKTKVPAPRTCTVHRRGGDGGFWRSLVVDSTTAAWSPPHRSPSPYVARHAGLVDVLERRQL
jgi:hypothetical protein